MRDVTLIMAYYENPGMLRRHYRAIDGFSKAIRDHLRLIVVDDGSPTSPAKMKSFIPMKIYRMKQDIRWNQDACRNIGAEHCETEWMVLTDIDHLIPEKTWEALIFGKFSDGATYTFRRVSEPHFEPYKPHPNSWFLTRRHFRKIGGYDERFAGWYGTDFDFSARARKAGEVFQLKESIIRVPRDVTPDASTTTYKRKTDEDKEAIKRIRQERGEVFEPVRLSFPYSRVLA